MERVTNRPARILRLPEVEARTGLSRSTIYRWRIAGRFPPAVVMGGRTLGWFESDVERWLQSNPRSGAAREAAPNQTPNRERTE
ncbi:MAG: AlpA family phage regulatory protein [Gammaproteobacteria bacterium]|nr:AlpA family phage regulatory protein [Gammaproteobacteria bacterium]